MQYYVVPAAYSAHDMIGTLASEEDLGLVFGSVGKLGFRRLVLFISSPFQPTTLAFYSKGMRSMNLAFP
jgi:hypothetical protein